MSQRKVTFAIGEFYHIYNRGNSKQVIFRDDHDYKRFQQLLYVMNSDQSVTFRLIEKDTMFVYDRGQKQVGIGAYCLMPNHFHLLLTPTAENGIQFFMQKLSTAYSMYFNKKYERTGGLFEGRFKSEHADSDEYLKYLFSYIHLNPVKLIQNDWKERGIVDPTAAINYLQGYAYSSFLDSDQVSRKEGSILDKDIFPVYFETVDSFRTEIFEWITFTRPDLEPVQGPALYS
jgi:REP element-mobilizing transposase RayT